MKVCSHCQKDLEGAWINVMKIDWTTKAQEGKIHFHINSEKSVGHFCKDCSTLLKDNYNNHIFDVNLNNGAWKMSKCPWCEQPQGGIIYLQDCSRILEHYMECDKKKHLSPPAERERERERERKASPIDRMSLWISP